MQAINDFLGVIDGYLGGGPWFVYLLLGTGLFFTIYLRFPQIRFFRRAISVLTGKHDNNKGDGDTTHFQALTTALSGTVGTGNIAGVALAIHLGGPAALFWMLVTAMLGMTTKMTEVMLSHKYREKTSDKTISGGPMYYMKNRLKAPWLAVIFAVATVLCSFGTGNLPQINSIANSVNATFSIPNIYTGGILAVFLGLVIIGGIKRIASITEKLVPTMAAIYLIGALSVIIANTENILPSLQAILGDVFTGSAATGGFLGGSIAFAFSKGVGRGLFSNEAGQGSAPIAHAAAKADEPVSEGLVSLLEPFIDTIIICTITGLTLLASGVWKEKLPNNFQATDIQILRGVYAEDNNEQALALKKHILAEETLPLYSGMILVENGKITTPSITMLHARSVAIDVLVQKEGENYNGIIEATEGSVLVEGLTVSGKSLLHSAPLTAVAFNRGWFGDYGEYIVAIGLLLFAFSTAIAWSYYGDRAITFLWGVKYVNIYRGFYVVAFFFASFIDTTLIWTFSNIMIVIMTVPNLIGILLLHKEVKRDLDAFEKTSKN